MTTNAHNPQAPQTPAISDIRCYAPLSHGSLFSGIGGFDLAAEWVGWDNRFHCEWNEFGKKILKHYWPNAESYGDITKTDFSIWRGRIDVLTGGFPCQPYSLAGKRKGKDDERHLWPEMLRAICEIAPRYIVGENVPGIVNWNGGLVFNEVQANLEAEGYEVQPVILPACAVNAPHRRERVWFVAHSNKCATGPSRTSARAFGCWSGNNDEPKSGREQTEQCFGYGNVQRINTDSASQQSERLQPEQREFSNQEQGQFGRNSGGMGDWVTANTRCSKRKNWLHGKEQGGEAAKFGNSYTKFGRFAQFPTTEPTIRGGNDGIPTQLDGITFSKWRNESIKAFGNAIVPQVAFQIFRAIQLHDASLSGA